MCEKGAVYRESKKATNKSVSALIARKARRAPHTPNS